MTQASAGIPTTDSLHLPITPPCSSLSSAPFSYTPRTTRNPPQPGSSVLTPTHHSFPDALHNTHVLSSRSKQHVARAIRNSWASSTVRRYSGAIKQFIWFCDEEGIPNHLRFPADEFVLCAFAASSIGIHARSTPRNRLSALKAWHVVHNMEWKSSARLRYVLNGVHNLAPRGSRRRPSDQR
jgi:hypothetical protein